jgi:hypothetical protein
MVTNLVTRYWNPQILQFKKYMQDSTKIEQVKFEHNGKEMIPTQTYMTPFGEIYIAFKMQSGAFINIPSSQVKEYVVGSYSPEYPL